MNEQKPRKQQQYADSSISDKAFKRAIIWFGIYCTLFCIGVAFVVNLDNAYMP
ncbi:hypothetical protein [Acinetobacter bouvetii]|uniref:Uncharacterized protein n=1 Tax=Acinetobacter bouvetii TaxID=202951 RepID=A0A811GEL3_9GAMM|nr:hypothetical protein [Acinetobacter bouvetii]CAB1221713.1 hypothetical protein SFB21_2947 [Acinetobacter bouvetii]